MTEYEVPPLVVCIVCGQRGIDLSKYNQCFNCGADLLEYFQ